MSEPKAVSRFVPLVVAFLGGVGWAVGPKRRRLLGQTFSLTDRAGRPLSPLGPDRQAGQ